jgi:CMP-N-acetylneuraminic acid synthetase
MLPMTQNITPIQICAWSVCVWKAKTFIQSYEEKGHAVFSGEIGLYPLSIFKSVKVSTDEDFMLAEALMNYRNSRKS